MADPSISFNCGGCGISESLPLDTLQLVGREPWLNADGWRARRAEPHTVRCADCWAHKPLAPDADVEAVHVRPRDAA